MAENNYITMNMEKGVFYISDEVISGIVRPAVSEVDGVAELTSAPGNGITEYMGKNSFRGIKVRFENQKIIVDVVITVAYGFNIVEVANNTQKAVCSSIQNMTGFDDVAANVHVAGISFK